MTKKPAPPAPSCVTVSPAGNVRSRIDAAIDSSSLRSRPAKSGTRSRTSIDGVATARFIPFRETTRVKLTVVGCSPAWPNPGGAQSGYLVEDDGRLLLDCGPGVLARLRETEGWPRVDAIVITHFHLDHWGDLVPWTWGAMYGPGRDAERPQLWVPPGGRDVLRGFGDRLGFQDMFERVFDVREYRDEEPFEAAGLPVTPVRVPHYDLLTFGMRVQNRSTSLA